VRVSYGLREGDELFVWKFEDTSELHIIKRASEDRSQPFRCAEQVDVLADEGGIYGRYGRPITGHLHHQKGHDQRTDSDNILWSRSDEGYRTLVL